ncbi:hypothetical protein N0V83_000929 [Neocucurbitaria cava]|uniref:Uncharacterized protein n=1 Tax=Neocucurbitaria cava TaxID=798079 RepID=A0A9W9CSG9_9PLEO|nr:hypothetical protein N0V83_000929 [Neocucurbitaria cava]
MNRHKHARDASPIRRRTSATAQFNRQPGNQPSRQHVPAPPTASDLRGYTNHVTKKYGALEPEQRFSNGPNGKVKPVQYGSNNAFDLGLCFTTFCTQRACEMGLECPWRHHPLTKDEKEWMKALGRNFGKPHIETEFLSNVESRWSFPEVPLPGKSMFGKSQGFSREAY